MPALLHLIIYPNSSTHHTDLSCALVAERQLAEGGAPGGGGEYNTGSIFLLLQSLRRPRGNRPDVSPLEMWFDLKPV